MVQAVGICVEFLLRFRVTVDGRNVLVGHVRMVMVVECVVAWREAARPFREVAGYKQKTMWLWI